MNCGIVAAFFQQICLQKIELLASLENDDEADRFIATNDLADIAAEEEEQQGLEEDDGNVDDGVQQYREDEQLGMELDDVMQLRRAVKYD